ncbi:SDR family NAD(P)-dependent oxidoreductase [Exiguobacterium aestuarii]|uniref:SDR family NAD(P)-dependent oxidoreductase n=1 Tax=Exiguobacterium aestuarii TaxID=273527 RepID=A0ABW2PJN9_9BACL|nr:MULTISPECIES: SDR family NAD(P)-dependent oxidoreductase [Exiguobacterium]MCT4786026.1 SDR family NAD(P)-dependent oxidoreductase [Exiguobacterium aestuarii]
MKLALVTGASRGLGRAIAQELQSRGYEVVGLSRSKAEDVTFEQRSVDLSSVSGIETAIEEITPLFESADSILLVQNAAWIEPIHRVGQLNGTKVTAHVHANLLAPMLLANAVLSFNKPTKLIHVTSGAAKRPISGWSAYCGTKAGLDHFTETLALELDGTPHRAALFNPGVMDTSMQAEIRSSSEEAFADLEQFRSYETEGRLRSPETVARVFAEQLIDRPLENGKTYSIYDLIK